MPSCFKDINEYCERHPVDCENCENEDTCQMKEMMLAHPDKIKRCRFFKRK